MKQRRSPCSFRRTAPRGTRAAGLLLGALASAIPPGAATAQEGARNADAEELEVVVVTATKRDELLKDVPIAVNVFTADDIERTNVTRPPDFIRMAPNVNVTTGPGFHEQNVSIRGIQGNFQLVLPIALVVDGVVSSNREALNQELVGIEQIEVVKGPQSAVYGRNANAGAIIINTRRPSATFESKFVLGMGNDSQEKAQAYVSGPLLGESLRGLVSVSHTATGGQYDNIAVNAKADRFQEHVASTRLIYEPGDRITLDLRARYSKIIAGNVEWSTQMFPYEEADTSARRPFPAIQRNNNQPDYQTRRDFALKMDVDLAGATLTTIGSVSDYEMEMQGDNSVNPLFFTDPQAWLATNPRQSGGWSYTTADGNMYARTNNEDTSVEVRLQSSSDTRLKWMAGIYYASTERDFQGENRLDRGGTIIRCILCPQVLDPTGINPTLRYDASEGEAEDEAIFGQLQYSFTDSLEGSVAVRYDEETNQSGDAVPVGMRSPVTAALFSNTAGQVRERKDTELQPQVSLRYTVSDQLSVYGAYGKGYRPGGFVPPGSTQRIAEQFGVVFPSDDSFIAETSDAFELGFKSEWLNRHLLLNAAVFYTDVENAQNFLAFPGVGGTQIVMNMEKVVNKGFEIELAARVFDDWRISESFGLTDSKIKEATVAPGLVGRKIQNSPEYTNTLGIDFNRGIGARYSLQAHVDWKLIGPLYFDSFNTDFARRDEVNLVDGRLALRRDAEQGTSWQVSLWGRNLFDERYNEYAAPVIGIANYTYRGPMRSYGVDFTVQF